MTDHVNYVGRVDHPILMDESDQTVMIKGFTGRLAGDVMLFNSFGRHYLDYGITDGSLLLCANGIEPHDGDLVIKMNQGKPAVYIFRLGSTAAMARATSPSTVPRPGLLACPPGPSL